MSVDLSDIMRLETLLILGLLFKALGFLARDEMWLRGLVLVGVLFDISFYATQSQPFLPPLLSAGLLILINLVVIYLIIRERTTFAMNAREKRLFVAFQTLSPGQFRRIQRLAKFHNTAEPVAILQEGVVPDQLYYIEGFRFDVQKGGDLAEAKGPAFAGEIAFLIDTPASATVSVPPGTPFVSWSVADLQRIMGRNPALKNALVARFSLDLAQKVARSMPMANAEVR